MIKFLNLLTFYQHAAQKLRLYFTNGMVKSVLSLEISKDCCFRGYMNEAEMTKILIFDMVAIDLVLAE